MVAVKKFFIEKRWALVAILIGVFWGFGSAILCIAFNLVIFGFNIMYIVSPLIAGFAETFIARRRYGKSTGAISALLTFLLINGYGWFGPGLIFPREPATLSLITIIAIILTLQAAFPTLINYILMVTSIGIIKKFIGFLLYIPSKLLGRVPVEEKKEEEILPSTDEIFLNELPVPLLSVNPSMEKNIIKYVGMVGGEAVAKEKEVEGRASKLTKIIEPTLLEDMYLGDARKLAISRMLDEAKSIGANNVVDVLVDYVSMGGLQGTALIVTAIGTAVIVGDENSDLDSNKPENNNIRELGEIGNSKIHDNTEIETGYHERSSVLENQNSSSKGNRIKIIERVVGREVVDESAMVVGKVNDVELNLDERKIEGILLSKKGASKNLGLSKEELFIPYEDVEQFGDRLIIRKINSDGSSDDDYYSYLERKIRNIN